MKGQPDRLYTVQEEQAEIRKRVGRPDFERYATMDSGKQLTYRNSYVTARMYAIDLAFSEFEAELTRERQGLGFGSTVASMGLTAAAGIVSPTTTKNILTAAASGVIGAKSAYSDEILAKQTVQILQTQMQTNRARIAALIYARLASDTTAYPLGAALSDLEEYYQAGTITGALVGVNIIVGEQSQAATDEKNTAKLLTLATDQYRMKLQSFIYPSGTSNPPSKSNQDKVRKLLQPGERLPNVLGDTSYLERRKQLVEQLGL